ncbi:hypothetical protein [Undibacterium flavidum]|uniref:Uncharacterized protein n=1 Tax=Undibacterium flavidum TaxID=2762297 RepID=A0ABR6Y9Z0_9BURK|nr:hypothetical protein [Undibacterium flavidum]MBC3873377.1 hypothetical protein [Undibacterium flavidum]
MKSLFSCIFLSIATSVFAMPQLDETPLTNEAKSRFKDTLREALRNKDITRKQYFESISWVGKYPCKGIDRRLSKEQKIAFGSIIAKLEKYNQVEVLGVFRYNNWHIIYIDNHVSDEPYMFYSSNPVSSKRAITSWSGVATIFETTEIEEWVLKNAHGIPRQLASCFAWYVTLNSN